MIVTKHENTQTVQQQKSALILRKKVRRSRYPHDAQKLKDHINCLKVNVVKKADILKRAFSEKAVATNQTNFGFQERVLKCQKCWVIVCFRMKMLGERGKVFHKHILFCYSIKALEFISCMPTKRFEQKYLGSFSSHPFLEMQNFTQRSVNFRMNL